MSSEARATINSHRLMQEAQEAPHVVRVDHAHAVQAKRKQEEQRAYVHRMWWHAAIFLVSFVFTVGFTVLSVLLWVQPEDLFALVVLGIVTSLVFVVTFAGVRIVVFHKLVPGPLDHEEDVGWSFHIGKSIAYGLVALVVAILIAGLLIRAAAAFSM